ncbi:MAG: tetratricopeptide repeat protein [Acidobacteriia bacterium]|nr:tetratricopeptide repeat protein [Terriglobia bacterium]
MRSWRAVAATMLSAVLLLVAAAGLAQTPGGTAAAPQVSPQAAEQIARGFELLGRNDASAAEAAFRQAIEVQPEAELAHRGLGLALRGQGKLAAALRELETATRLDPNDADAYYALGELAWTLSARSLPGQTSNSSFSPADYRDLATGAFQKALALRPKDATLRLNLTELYLQAGRGQAALSEAQEAVRLAPENSAAHLALGRAYFAVGEEEQAASQYESALKLDPKEGAAYLGLGQLRLRQRRYTEAEAAFRHAIEVSPQMATAYVALAQVLVQDGHGAEARSLFEKAVALDPQDWESQYQLARLLMQAGEVDRATRIFGQVARAHPEFLPAREQLALGLLRRGDVKSASAQAEAMLAQDPRAPEGHRLMALVLRKQPDLETSLSECAQVLASDPNDPAMLALQALELWQLGQKRPAQQAYRQAAKVEPQVGSSDVFCRLIVCDARDIGPVTEFLHKNRWVLEPAFNP